MHLSPTLIFALTVPAALTRFCSSDAPPPPASGSPAALFAQAASAGITASAVAPQFGGQVAVSGTRVVEVLPRADGMVLAEVRDATGAPMQTGRVLVDVAGADGQRYPVELHYDTDLRVFEGSASGRLAPAPSNVVVTVRPQGEAPTVTAMPGVPVAPVPAHGGQTIVVGGLAPEVRVDANGEVHAYLPQDGPRVPSGTLYANVNVGQAAPRRVELEYDDNQGHYVAHLGPDAHPAGGELTLDLDINGETHHGRVRQLTVVPPSRLGGVMVVAGDYGLEVAPVDGELQATIADRSGVYVSAPPPTIEVRVDGRPAPVVMRWDVSRRVYVAPLPVGVNVETAPITVEVRAGGRRHRGTVHLHGRHGHRGRDTVVVVDHPTPSPRVTVEINAPPPPHVDIRIGHPAPHADVRIRTDNGRHRGHGKHRKVRGHGGMGGMGGRHR